MRSVLALVFATLVAVTFAATYFEEDFTKDGAPPVLAVALFFGRLAQRLALTRQDAQRETAG